VFSTEASLEDLVRLRHRHRPCSFVPHFPATMTVVAKLINELAAQLERPREVTVQVANYLDGNYEVDRDAIGAFLTDKLPGLEDYEHDLILSPLFTPKLADQAIFAGLLGRESVPRDQWEGLIRELEARPTQAHLVTSDRQVHTFPLREVTLERYVHRLRLDGTIPETLFDLLQRAAPAEDLPLLMAIARRAIWEAGSRRSILTGYLTSAGAIGDYRLSDAIYLLELAENYKPADVPALLLMIPPWLERLREEIDTAGNPKPFFTPQVQGEHGGDRDQRRPDERAVDAKRDEMATLARLQKLLSTV
jgi:hypothetical protein